MEPLRELRGIDVSKGLNHIAAWSKLLLGRIRSHYANSYGSKKRFDVR